MRYIGLVYQAQLPGPHFGDSVTRPSLCFKFNKREVCGEKAAPWTTLVILILGLVYALSLTRGKSVEKGQLPGPLW